jgi:hypothetical protein
MIKKGYTISDFFFNYCNPVTLMVSQSVLSKFVVVKIMPVSKYYRKYKSKSVCAVFEPRIFLCCMELLIPDSIIIQKILVSLSFIIFNQVN